MTAGFIKELYIGLRTKYVRGAVVFAAALALSFATALATPHKSHAAPTMVTNAACQLDSIEQSCIDHSTQDQRTCCVVHVFCTSAAILGGPSILFPQFGINWDLDPNTGRPTRALLPHLRPPIDLA